MDPTTSYGAIKMSAELKNVSGRQGKINGNISVTQEKNISGQE
jgi:hypothetical protein